MFPTLALPKSGGGSKRFIFLFPLSLLDTQAPRFFICVSDNLLLTVHPSGMGWTDLCLHKDQSGLFLMSRAPVNEQRSGIAAVSTAVRLCEWRGLGWTVISPCKYAASVLYFLGFCIQISQIDIKHFHLLHRCHEHRRYDGASTARDEEWNDKAKYCALTSHDQCCDRIA